MKAKKFKHLMTHWSEKKNKASRYLDKKAVWKTEK